MVNIEFHMVDGSSIQFISDDTSTGECLVDCIMAGEKSFPSWWARDIKEGVHTEAINLDNVTHITLTQANAVESTPKQ